MTEKSDVQKEWWIIKSMIKGKMVYSDLLYQDFPDVLRVWCTVASREAIGILHRSNAQRRSSRQETTPISFERSLIAVIRSWQVGNDFCVFLQICDKSALLRSLFSLRPASLEVILFFYQRGGREQLVRRAIERNMCFHYDRNCKRNGQKNRANRYVN